MAEMVEKLVVKIELSDDMKRDIQAYAEEVAADVATEVSKAFEARIRSIVFEAMRERDMRVATRSQ